MQSKELQTYFDESVLAFILELKPRKFHYHKESNTLISLYLAFVALLLPYT